MRIAQISPLYESVPPKTYGGTERVVSTLTEELVRRGHHVTLFASGDSLTGAELVPACPRSLRLDAACADDLAHHVLMLERVLQRSEEFDILHFHTGYLHFPLARRARTPSLTTMHGRLDLPDIVPICAEFRDLALVSISDHQRLPLPGMRWAATIHHGLQAETFPFHPEHQGYLAFLGRICPEKRPDRAVEIAIRAGVPLKIAAKIDPADRDYYEQKIRRLFRHPLVEFVGEIGEAEKGPFLGGAMAMLFPIDWPEPFGLTMIESLACGTPVIAWPNGSVPEVLEHGATAFLVRDVAEAAARVADLGRLSRRRCRREFERRFTVRAMADAYLAVYDTLLYPLKERCQPISLGPRNGRIPEDRAGVLHPGSLRGSRAEGAESAQGGGHLRRLR